MGMLTFLAPIRPGKLDEHKRFIRDIAAKSNDHTTSRKRMGLDLERAYYQKMPDGNFMLVVHVEGAGAESFLKTMLDADTPYDRWFRERIADIHGMDLRAGIPALPKLINVLDTDVPKNAKATAYCSQLPPDDVQPWLDFMRQVQARRPEHKSSRERVGISRECVHLAEDTPIGPCVLVYMEGVNSLAESELMKSDHPFDRWFIDNISHLHGINFRTEVANLKNDCALDWSVQRGVTIVAASSRI
jgi:hypothetical protein